MSAIGDQIGIDATAAIKAAEGGLTASTEASILVSMKSIGNAVDSNKASPMVPSFASAWTLIDSLNTFVEFNPFSTARYVSAPFSTAAASSRITHNQTTGEFIVADTGTYSISASIYLQNAGLVILSLYVDGVVQYRATPYVHSSVDPSERSVTALLNLTAGQAVTLTISNTAGSIAVTGTAFAVMRIA